MTGAPPRTQIDAVEHDQIFAFIVPVLRAWLAFGSGQGDPLAALPAAGGQGVAAAYAAEHRAVAACSRWAGRKPPAELLAPPLGRAARGAAAGRRRGLARPPRRARRRARPCSRAMARRSSPRARSFRRGGRCPARSPAPTPAWPSCSSASRSISTAQEMTQLGGDVRPARAPGSRPTIARPGWSRPNCSRSRTSSGSRCRCSPMSPRTIRSRSPSRDQRIRILLDGGDRDAALADALAGDPRGVGRDHRLGPARRGLWRDGPPGATRPRPIGRALAVRRDGDDAQAEWALWLMRGGALDEAGNWPEARDALQQRLSARARAALRAQLSRLCPARPPRECRPRPSD